jgi:hypothetical protein
VFVNHLCEVKGEQDGGIATPVARTACEACAESLLRIRATNSIYVFQGWKINFAELPDGIHK